MQVATTTLDTPTPFSLKTTVLSHGWHECSPMTWCEGGRCFEVIERDGDRAYRVSVVEHRGRSKRTKLAITVAGEEVNDGLVETMRARIARALSLGHDLSEFHAICREHRALRDLPRIGGGRLIRSASMAENIVKMICGTNVTWTQAVKMINRIAQLGPHVPHFRHQNAWPTPREILRAGPKYLTEVCRLGYRADSILHFCQSVCDGSYDPEALFEKAETETTDALLTRLKSIRGIGPASAHALLALLGRHERLGIDSATIAHVAKVHMNGKKPTPKQVERIYARFGRWKHLVYWSESWLQWDTARDILREPGDGRAIG